MRQVGPVSPCRRATTAHVVTIPLQQEQLWAACAGYDDIYVWSLQDLAQPPQRIHLQDCSKINCMIQVKKQVRRPRGC